MKTKVVAFRVTQDEYDGLALAAVKEALGVGEFVRRRLIMHQYVDLIVKERKRLERAAKRHADKTAAQVVPDGNA